MKSRTGSLPVIDAEDARRALLQAQGLLADPARRATPARILEQIERMGYVQIDTISVVERAHHHILRSRFDAYHPRMLAKLLERDRKLFENWTHDLSAIPSRWFRHWRPRFERNARTPPWRDPRIAGLLGPRPEALADAIIRRIRREGPLRSRDFERTGPRDDDALWSGKPQRFVLDHLLHAGRLLVSRRDGTHRVYDLPGRVLPEVFGDPPPSREELVDWACREALERLVVATPRELMGFFGAVRTPDAKVWCEAAAARGEIDEVLAASAERGKAPVRAFAVRNWRRRRGGSRTAPDRIRPLSPFDPVLRDRRRALRLFGFDYRFEAFVPAAKRRYGYYVLPLLEADRLVGRLDAKLHRDRGHLEVKGLWWEPGVPATRARRARLDEALSLLVSQLGGETWSQRKL